MKNKKLILFSFTLILTIFSLFLTSYSNTPMFFPIWQNKQQNSNIFSKAHGLLWSDTGKIICNASADQRYTRLCSDGAGGAIITWQDSRGTTVDIYAQMINSSGDVKWANGTPICTEGNDQNYPEICSDGLGGAFITWEDYRDGNLDIYAQYIASSGVVQMPPNGTVICNHTSNQDSPNICSDGAGGTIIAWKDNRDGGFKIYAQKVLPNGTVLWTPNGVQICTSTSVGEFDICTDGGGGAIITWDDADNIFVQNINSNGVVQWGVNGMAVCTASNQQLEPKICTDGWGDVIITWRDNRFSDWDIYAQKINTTPSMLWGTNGKMMCNASGEKQFHQICCDGVGGAFITWSDNRSFAINGLNIFAQKVLANGVLLHGPNATPICIASNNQVQPQICSDGAGGAIIAWHDQRVPGQRLYIQKLDSSGNAQWTFNGELISDLSSAQQLQICSDGRGGAIVTFELQDLDYDLFAQHIVENNPPTSNQPANIDTTTLSSETINWTLYDDWGTGQYRVWANDTNDNYYILHNWIDWDNDSNLMVSINRTATGVFNYTIEYNDTFGEMGTPHSVIVNITLGHSPPTSNQPANIHTTILGSETINWTLYDDLGPGKYWVWANDTNDNYYLWQNSTDWFNETNLEVPINRSATGVFNYTIEYNDSLGVIGTPHTVIVNITLGNPPTSNQPADIHTTTKGSETINWTLYDDLGSGQYRVWANDTNGNYYIWQNWTDWFNETNLMVPINRTAIGVFNYTIEYNDSLGLMGTPHTVIVNITAAPSAGPLAGLLTLLLQAETPSQIVLPVSLIIFGTIVGIVIIVIFIKKRK